VVVPDWIWFVIIFAFGCCIGSFLNVVIYRLPRDQSLIMPPSACPACGRGIRFYDNVPLISWLVLGRKCRFCKAPISPRYFVIELLTGLVFLGLFIIYFRTDIRALVPFVKGGWFVYFVHLILLAALIAASAIDLELWVIPVSICWFLTVVGLIGSALGTYVIDPAVISQHLLLPTASVKTASLAAGAAIGLAVSLILLATGLIKRSYESEEHPDSPEKEKESAQQQFNHHLEICREIIFLLPIIICSIVFYLVSQRYPQIHYWWLNCPQKNAITGLLGSLLGYFVGCGVVWMTRILGTLGFGKEAMGLGDVHLMGAAGAVVGPVFVVVAFLIAPFFGLVWAGFQMFFKKTRQISYGPFLSLGILFVMILHNSICNYLISIFCH